MNNLLDKTQKYLNLLPKPLLKQMEKQLKRSKKFRDLVESENKKLEENLLHSLKPYRNQYSSYESLPTHGIPREEILKTIEDFNEKESPRWQSGFVSGGIYHGDLEHIQFLNKVYALQSQSNPLHSDIFPSATKFEAEIISMVAHMHGKNKTAEAAQVCGTVTSGGTESILLAMKTYRDQALEERGIKRPEMITATTAHVAFDKAAQYFGIKQIKIPLTIDFKMDVELTERAITRNTIVIVGSAPTFPHGAIDPIEQLSNLALKHKIGFHTDSCLGGFIIPFAEKLGYNVPKIDFRLHGVTSMSVDTHKYGYAAKGTSVLLYRNEKLRHFQFFTSTDWPGGLYFSPTLAGSRPGALSATCWATMLSIGESGYLQASKAILEAGEKIKKGIAEIPELELLGDPLWVISFKAKEINIYEIMDQMSKRQWNLNGLHKPSCVHIALTLRHTQPGVCERFMIDLVESVAFVKANPGNKDGMAPVYGMASSIPFRGLVSDLLKKTLDVIYKV